MRSAFFLASVVLHGALFGGILYFGRQPRSRQPQQIAVVRQKARPQPARPTEEPPPPAPPLPRLAAPPPRPAAPERAQPPKGVGPRFSTGLTLGNGSGGGGVSLGALAPALGGPSHAGPPPLEPRADRPPPPRAQAPEVVCDDPDTKPRPAGTNQVEYSDRARAEGLEGRIQVLIHVASDGAVSSLEVVSGIEPGLDAYVLSMLRTWRFLPATHCGRAVAGTLSWAQRFELGD
jgi:periplasmic protein TonB